MAGTLMTEVKIVVNKTVQEVSYEPITIGFEAVLKNENGVDIKDIRTTYRQFEADIDKIVKERITQAPTRYKN